MRGLRRIQDRGGQQRTEHAAVGDREGAAGHVLDGELAVARLQPVLADLRLDVGEAHRIGVAQHRHHQAAIAGDRHADVLVAVVDDVVAVDRGVDRREALQRLDAGAHEERPMKPSRVPLWRFSNAPCTSRAASITGCMSTSLKVVSIAVLREASSRRSATRARSRVIGTRRSTRPSALRATSAAAGVDGGSTEARAATGAAAAGGAAGAGACCAWREHVLARDAPALAAAGHLRRIDAVLGRGQLARRRTARLALARRRVPRRRGRGRAAQPARRPRRRPRSAPMTSWLSTVSPASLRISASAPSAGATTSSTTLSVSMSTITSSRRQASPGSLVPARDRPSADRFRKRGRLDIDAHVGSSCRYCCA